MGDGDHGTLRKSRTAKVEFWTSFSCNNRGRLELGVLWTYLIRTL